MFIVFLALTTVVTIILWVPAWIAARLLRVGRSPQFGFVALSVTVAMGATVFWTLVPIDAGERLAAAMLASLVGGAALFGPSLFASEKATLGPLSGHVFGGACLASFVVCGVWIWTGAKYFGV